MTQEEANGKFCPMLIVANKLPYKCKAADCMWWSEECGTCGAIKPPLVQIPLLTEASKR
jgi:hypothetical protein